MSSCRNYCAGLERNAADRANGITGIPLLSAGSVFDILYGFGMPGCGNYRAVLDRNTADRTNSVTSIALLSAGSVFGILYNLFVSGCGNGLTGLDCDTANSADSITGIPLLSAGSILGIFQDSHMSGCLDVIVSIGITADRAGMGGIARRCAGGRGYNVLILMAHSVCVAVNISIAASRTSVGSIAALCAGGFCDNCLIAMGRLGQGYLKAERPVLILFPGIPARSLLGTGRLMDDLIVIILHGQLWKRYNRSCLALAACSFQLSGCGYRRRNGDFIRIAMVCHRGFRILIGTTANRTGMGSIALFRAGRRGYNILVGMLGFRNHGAERE